MGGEGERPFPATPRRLRKARQDGDVAKSPLAASALGVIACAAPAVACRGFAAWWTAAFAKWSTLGALLVHSGSAGFSLLGVGLALIDPRAAGPLLAAVACGALAAVASAAATGALGFSPGAIAPKARRWSLLAGVRALLDPNALRKTAGALCAVAAIVACAVPEAKRLIASQRAAIALSGQPVLLVAIGRSFWATASAALIAIAFADIWIAKMQHARRLRMTLQEVRDERAEHEGKPELKARRRAVAAKRRRLRVGAIKSAAVVVTNPTHVAVALRYAPPSVDVPIVVTSAAGAGAAVVRAVASYHEVPIVESPVLARALYDRVGLDEPIPDELYTAVAMLFSWLLRVRGRLGS